MRVLLLLREFYSPAFPIGGAERQALKLVGELNRMGVSVKIVTGLWQWGQPPHEVIQGVSIDRHFTAWGMFGIKGLRKFGFYSYLVSLILYLFRQRNEYDVIHCHSALVEAAVGVLAGGWLKKPTLIRPMASGAFGDYQRLSAGRGLLGQGWLASKLRQADAIVALNPQIAEEMASLGMNRDRIVFIPNGVEVNAGSQRRSYTQHNSLRIAFVGRIHPQKGISTLLKALGRLTQENPDLSWRLQLAGTGPSQGELKALADELGIGQAVEFLGHLDRVDDLLEQSDCLVLPSLSEGMSNALLEAMAHGLPCIASDIPGNNNLIQHRCNGLLFPPDADKALAEAIFALAQDEALRQKLGQEAFRTVESNYSLQGVARQYADLYANLVKGKTG